MMITLVNLYTLLKKDKLGYMPTTDFHFRFINLDKLLVTLMYFVIFEEMEQLKLMKIQLFIKFRINS